MSTELGPKTLVEALKNAAEVLLFAEYFDDGIHGLESDHYGDGWNEPYSDHYLCSCGGWEFNWRQKDPTLSDRPEPHDVLVWWANHVETEEATRGPVDF